MSATTEQPREMTELLQAIDKAYLEWMLRVAPDKRTLLMAFRAGYLAAIPSRRAAPAERRP